jgi:hypothetical protein
MPPIIEQTSMASVRQSVKIPNCHSQWNKRDEKYLRQANDNGINITEITKTLGRSRSSILQRIHKIGLSAKSIMKK